MDGKACRLVDLMNNEGSSVPAAPAYVSFMQAHNHLAKLAVATILYNCRINRVQKQSFDLLVQLVAHLIYKLSRQMKQMILSEDALTSSLILVGSDEEICVNQRSRACFAMDSVALIDLFLSNFTINGGNGAMYANFRTEEPSYGLLELLDFARAQARLFPAKTTISEESMELERRGGPSNGDSYFEKSGHLSTAYRLTPKPAISRINIFLNSIDEQQQQTSNDPVKEE